MKPWYLREQKDYYEYPNMFLDILTLGLIEPKRKDNRRLERWKLIKR